MEKLTADKTTLEQLCINTIRFLSVDGVEKAKSGHPCLPMEAAPIGYVLWTKYLRHNPKNPKWPGRDRFVLSAGHGSMLIYSLLFLTGYDLTLEDIKAFRQWGSKTPGHPEYGETPGVETTTGPLGQGFANAVGMGMAQKFLAGKFNKPNFPLLDYQIYCVCSDGDMMEGISSEAASLAGHLKLDNLIYIYLDNHVSLDGPTDLSFSEDVGKRFEAYHWHVQHIEGNDTAAISGAIEQAQRVKGEPHLIIARTHLGYGSPHKQDTAAAHGSPLGADEVKATKQNLGWPLEPAFYVPKEALDCYRLSIESGQKREDDWKTLYANYKKAFPELADEFDRFMKGELPSGWKKALPSFQPKDGPLATRQASNKAINALAPALPFLFGGSADLATSTETTIKDSGDFEAGRFDARNLRFGVREHAMAGALNGIALSGAGFIAYGGTFFNFLDYCKPSVRLAALMKLRTIYVFTHDSVGLGEDGPTHQPVEQLATLRATPNVLTIRPADANETVAAWRVAIEHQDGPVCLVLTRQKLPILDRTKFSSADQLEKGAYILIDSEGLPEIILMGSGSEVSIAMEAYEKLKEKNMKVRLVSIPSLDLFRKQPKEYRDRVLPPQVEKRIAIEAASSFGWREFVGAKGEMVGIDRFGASAPAEIIYEKLGLTSDHMISIALKMLGK